jgi:NTE family protein
MDGVDRPRIGIALSGGGLRAAFYALGCLRYLAEADLLNAVCAVSSVSGGSLAAATLADRWPDVERDGLTAFLEHVDEPFRTAVTSRDLRRAWMRQAATRWLAGDRRGRGAVLGDVLGELYRTRELAALPPGLATIFTATDLATGRAFRLSRDFIGSYDFGYVATPPLALGFAVAASAAFPGVFSSLALTSAGLGLRRPPQTLELVDGGVYDNMGIEWFQGWRPELRPPSAIEPDFLVVCNASGSLGRVDERMGGLRALAREHKIQYAQTLNVRIRWFVADLLRARRRGLYLGITGDPRRFKLADDTTPIDPALYDGALASVFVPALARMRTDLNRFTKTEADLLSYHAYWSTHARFGSFHPVYAITAPEWREYANLSDGEAAALLAEIAGGSHRAAYR